MAAGIGRLGAQRELNARIREYTRASTARAIVDIATSMVPYVVLSALAYAVIGSRLLPGLGLGLLAGGFLLRTFIVFHDCSHGSFLPSRRANLWVGRAAALLVFQPFSKWRHEHAVHHGTAGDLDRRGTGDVLTLTVDEYLARGWAGRLGYRLFRNPVVMFGVGPLYSLVVMPRRVPRGGRPRLRHSVQLTNLAVVGMVATLCLVVGWRNYLLVEAASAVVAGTAGLWLFFVQHQYEGVYWESSERWDYAEAALRGSSYLKLPAPLRFLTGNIGYHHVHHLSARIPNYNLRRAHEEIEVFRAVPVLTIRDGLRATRLKLWDERAGRLVTFQEVGRSAGAGAPVPADT